jgi:hypothetical protein
MSAWIDAENVAVKQLPGADVMITIFCDFSQFSAKKFAFFLNTNVMIIVFKIWLCFESKTPIFSLNFSAKIF